MTVSQQSFTQFVQNQAAAIQGAVNTLLNFTVGSVFRALIESNAAQALFLQAQALMVAALTRAATSFGIDLDSWMADYGVTRLAATQSTGTVTFARYTPTYATTIPVGSIVQSFDGSQQFTVIADPTNTAYSAALNGYVLAANIGSIGVLAKSVNAASITNVAANTITQIQGTIQYVDTVNNTAAFAGGSDPETDPALRTRFVAYIASLSKATKLAIQFAINSVQTGLSSLIVENQTYSGTTQMGYFYVVVDDGSGSPPNSLLNAVYAAIDLVRPITSTFGVFGPTRVTANVIMTIATGTGYVHATVVGLVTTALTNYINTLPLGTLLPFNRLAQIAFDASPGVTNVSGITLNAGTSDLAATSVQVIKAGTVSVS